MRKIIFIVIQVLIVNIALCQTNDMGAYKYVYKFKLDNYPTSCVIENTDSKLIVGDGHHNIRFICKHIDLGLDSLLSLTIIQDNDSVRLKSDKNGMVSYSLKHDYFDLIVNSATSEEVVFRISPEWDKSISNVIIYAGIDYSLVIPIVYSKRELKPKELFLIKEDIRNQTKKSKLLRNKTCILLFEM